MAGVPPGALAFCHLIVKLPTSIDTFVSVSRLFESVPIADQSLAVSNPRNQLSDAYITPQASLGLQGVSRLKARQNTTLIAIMKIALNTVITSFCTQFP